MRAIEAGPRRGRVQRTSRMGATVLAGSAMLLAAAHASAQATDAPPPAPERIVISFEQRTRVEKQTHPFRIDELGATRVLALRTRLQVDVLKIVGPVGAYVELQDSRSEWNDQPFVAPAQYINPLDFTQAFLRAGSKRFFGGRAAGGVLLGRFSLDLGRRRLSARNGIRNTTNAFDGVNGWLAAKDGSSLQVFLTRPVWLDPDRLDRSDEERLFWGTYLTLRRWPGLHAELYALRLDESGDTATRRRFTTLGGRLYRSSSPGQVDYEIESSWQGGTRQGMDHDALFLHLEAGYALRQSRTHLAAFYDHVSGDADPLDDRSGRFDTLFGARGFEYAPTGIYGPFFRGNIRGPGARLLVVPTPSVQIGLAYRALWLAEARDAWVGSGLQDESGAAGDALGHHLEGRLRWWPRSWLLVEARYCHFFKGAFVQGAPGSPDTPDSDYFTLAVELGGILLKK